MATMNTLSVELEPLLDDADFETLRAYVSVDQPRLTDPATGRTKIGPFELIRASDNFTSREVDLPDNTWEPAPHWYTLHVEYRTMTHGERQLWVSRSFQMDTDKTLADVPYEMPRAISETDYESLIAARDEAVAAKEAAEAAAETATAPTDEMIAGRINTPGSATATALLASDGPIATKVNELVPAASTAAQGKVELATVGETTTGTDTARAVTPAGVGAAVATVATTSRLRSPVPPMSSNVTRMIPTFPTGHGWAFSGAGATATVDYTSDFLLGAQCTRVVTTGAGGFWYLQKSGLALDLTSKHVRAYFKLIDRSKFSTFRLYLGDSGLTNNINFIIAAGAGTAASPVLSNQWTVLDIPLSWFTTVGTPNLAAIDTARIIGTDTGSGNVAEMLWGGISTTPRDELSRFPSGVVSFGFDDTFVAQTTIARPILDKYGYRATLFPIIERIGLSGSYLTLADVLHMRDQGWEIAAHASTNAVHNLASGIVGMTDAQKIAELETLRQWNADNGCMTTTYAYPQGFWNDASAAIVSRYYAAARLASSVGPVNVRPENPYRVGAVSVAGLSLAALKAHVDAAVAQKTHVSFLLHNVVASGATGNDITTANLSDLVDYIAAQGVAVRTFGEVMAAAAA